MIELRTCPMADDEHAASVRQYAHVFHYPRTICVARAFWRLPAGFRLGILMHEIGHLLLGPRGSEQEADRAVFEHAGVPVERIDSPYGDSLEWVPRQWQRQAASIVEEITGYAVFPDPC